MIQLSQEFIDRSNNKDTRKLVLVHLYYDEINYFPISTVSTVIDGIQYNGVINDISNYIQRWNIESTNNVTIASPKITLINYNTPDNYQLISEFFNHSFYGRKLIIYYGYEGMSLSSMVKSFDGFIDEVSFLNGNIEIEGKTNEIPTSDIQGRKINYNNQTIGVSAVDSSVRIVKENDGKIIPVLFGRHWCAPLQPYATSLTGKEFYYAINDSDYSPLLKNENHIKSDIIQFNVGLTGSQVFILNDEFYTPLHQQGWYTDSEQTYKHVNLSGNFLSGIKIPGDYGFGHVRSDNKIFVTVPLRYELATDQPDYFNIQTSFTGTITADAFPEFARVFDPFTYNQPFTIGATPYNSHLMWAKCYLNLSKNLKSDEKSFVRKGRKINIPSTESEDGGQGYLLGRFSIDIGTLGWFRDNIWVAVDTYPLTMHHYRNNYLPSPFALSSFSAYEVYVGGGDVGAITPTFTQGNPPVYNYNFMARVFNKTITGNSYSLIFDGPPPVDTYQVGRQGTQYLTPEMGNVPFINREVFDNDESLGAIAYLEAGAPKNRWGTSPTFTTKIWKIFHLTAGAVNLKNTDVLYTSATGVLLTNSNSLSSTPQNTDSYLMKRPYEYIEFLLKEKGRVNVSDDFTLSSITSIWNNFFGTSRDGSGFAIDKQITLDKFVDEYVKYEPFTTFASEDGLFQLKMLKKTYSDGDEDGVLDFNDAIKFNITLTPTKNVYAEIKSLKTDYMYGVDDYVLDINWRISSSGYDYGFYKIDNTNENNEFKLELMEKKYTSYVPVDVVSFGGKHYGCKKTNINQSPTGSGEYWTELNSTLAGVASWSSVSAYKGEDSENHSVASWYLNQWCNRHRVVSFSSTNLSYYRFNVGDVVQFTNVPYTLLGMNIKGFNGADNFTNIVNGQTVYASFIITTVNKSLNRIVIEAMQLHHLEAFNIERMN